ncbi:hypothetical protein Q4S45_19750 [Massilia sp. R2A-15]|nr:hypothetical protein [Massilia sp. R2A-15]WLI88913.1 hypothetical protein Q4S45_19750 [Massilia sp. R2A-15]
MTRNFEPFAKLSVSRKKKAAQVRAHISAAYLTRSGRPPGVFAFD